MRILIVTHYYPPEVGAPQARLSELARAWVASGDTVTVLTGFPNHPTGRIHAGYERRIRMRENIDGVHVVRTWLYATPNEKIARKTLGHLSFMLSSVLLGARAVGPADVVIVSSPTFFSIPAAWLIARVKRARFVVEVRDLWPAFIVELGLLRNRLVIGVLEAIELASYRAADAVVTVSRGFKDAITARGLSADKVHFVPNGVEPEMFDGITNESDKTRNRLGAQPGDTLILYAGTHGTSYALDDVLDVASELRREAAHFAFVGEGPTKSHLAARVDELGLKNVTMLPAVTHQEMPMILSAADICLVPDRDIPFLATTIRAKMFEYMAAGKAIVGSTCGESATILREAGAVVIPPEQPAEFARAIRELVSDPKRREAMGMAARRYVRSHFDRHVLANDYRRLLGIVVKARAR
jgi:glycosyltransferase involved in cell wall biosynthesis